MRIIISPAKKMNMDTDSFPFRNLPQFLPQAEHIYEHLKQMDYGALKALWNCSDSVARLNAERLSTLNLRQNLTPAILAYEGIQYRYMAPIYLRPQSWNILKRICVFSPALWPAAPL